MIFISLIYSITFANAQTAYLYPVQGQTFYQSLDKATTISGDTQFYIQEILTSQSMTSQLVSSNIIDISEGSLAGNPNFQNQYVGILSQSTSFYTYSLQYINANGTATIVISNSAISKTLYFCTDILLIDSFGYIQCYNIQTNQIIIFQWASGVFFTLYANIYINYTQLLYSDLNYYSNSTGEYLVSTFVTTQSQIYYIFISNPNNTALMYSSSTLYQQIQYQPIQNVLMLQSNASFEIIINNSTNIIIQGQFEDFNYYLSQSENILILSLLNTTNILVYYVNLISQTSYLVELLNISNQQQSILQMFMNTKYVILLGSTELEIYEFGRKELIASMSINSISQSYFMSQSNFIGIFLNNSTQSLVQINQRALICQLCIGNGTFNLSNEEGNTQYEYFTLPFADQNIYTQSSNNQNSYTLNYPAQSSYVLDFMAIGPNITVNLQQTQNDYLTLQITSIVVFGVAAQDQVPNFYGISYNQHTLLFDAIINMPTQFCTQFIGFDVQNKEVCAKTTGYDITQAVYWQITAYQTKYFLNTGQTIAYGVMDSSLINDANSPTCQIMNVSSNQDIIAISTIQSNLYVLLPNTLLIYDTSQSNPILQQQFNLNFRNIWSSDDYPGFLFCDNYQNLAVYQFYGNQFIQVLTIPYQIQNSSSIQIGLLIEGVYIQIINQTSQGLYFYNRQNIQMIQMNQIPFQQINVQVTMTNITSFTSKFFYMAVLNNGNSELSIYQASDSSFASLYQSICLNKYSITQIACASSMVQEYDVCYVISSGGLPQILEIFHYQVLEVQASFMMTNQSMDISVDIFNNYANSSTNLTINYDNPLIYIQSNSDNQPIITNSTQGQISISPQEYFVGNIQNYSISSNDSNITLSPLINLSNNFTFICMFSVETLGYLFLGNPTEIYISNGSKPTKIYLGPANTKILNLFVEVNTQYPAWIFVNEKENVTQLMYYNMSSLEVIQNTILNQSLYPGLVLYFDGPLIVQYSLYFWLFNISLVQNTLVTTTSLSQVSLNQKSESSSPYLIGFQINSNCFGYVYTTYVNTQGLITIVQQEYGTFEVFQDIIGFKMTFQNNSDLTNGEQIGQQIGSSTIDGQKSYISLLMVNQLIFYQLNIQFFNYRLVSHNVTNNYYIFSQPSSTSTFNISVSNSLIVLSQYISPYSIVALYPIMNQAVDYYITSIAYLNLSQFTTQANCAIFLSDNTLLFSNSETTLIYNINNQLVIDYSFTQNQTNIQLTAYNQYSQQTQNITVNQWQAPTPTPPSPTPPTPTPTDDKGFNYWIILWVSLGLLIVILMTVGIIYYRKSRQESELVLSSNLGYAELVKQ